MPSRLHYLWSNFSGGEWTPELEGRVDIEKYYTACSCLQNYLVRPQGGVTRRPGTKYVAEAKSSATKVRLVPMQVSATKSYILEVGVGYVRFYESNAQVKDSGSNPVEVSTPYAEADLFQIHRVPSVDVMYLLHRGYRTRRLERYADTCFRFRTVAFAPPATLEYGARPAARVQVSALTGDGVTADTFDGTLGFTAADVGREILVIDGCNAGARAGIASFDCPGSVLVNVCVPFLSTTKVDCGHWKLTASPQTTVTPSAATPVGKQAVTLTLTKGGWRGAPHAAGFTRAGDTDCGKVVLLNGGAFEIVSVTSCTVASTVIRGEASATTAGEPGAWSLEEPLWSEQNGYAETGAFLDGRLYLGACHRFAASKVGDYENFAPGVLDDDGLLFALDADVLQTIRWLAALRGMMIGTLSAEYQAIGGNESPITPDNIRVERQTSYGGSSVMPLIIGNAILFVTRSGRKLRELVENTQTLSGFVAPDLLLLARHLTERTAQNGSDPTIVDIAYQQEPDSRIWAVRSDGVLLSCTYLRDQNVVAWSRHVTEGSFESVAVIPHPDGDRDQVWVAVKRTINGQTKRYIEYFDDAGVNYAQTNVDAAFTCDQVTSACTVYGLAHLECARVTIVGDGGVDPDQNVVGGNVTLDRAVNKVEIGLPYDSVLVTMRPEVQTQEGSSGTAKMRWAKLVIRVRDTIGLIAGTAKGEEIVPWRSTCDRMDCAPSLFTGVKELPHLGWDCGKVTIKQTLPLPSTILSVSGTLDLGGG